MKKFGSMSTSCLYNEVDPFASKILLYGGGFFLYSGASGTESISGCGGICADHREEVEISNYF
ncbi:MAG: hypothetical protein LBB34_04570 [Holosporales bacterium]|nr:hypothetical protein [Holosporales bacterium]